MVEGEGGGASLSPAWESVYPAVCRQQASFRSAMLGCLKEKYPGGLGESYIGHSAAQAETCSQLASARIVFVSLDDAFYNCNIQYLLLL